MRKHKHEALIKEWLDTGMPPVEWFDHEENSWEPCMAPHGWFESQEYRLVFPPDEVTEMIDIEKIKAEALAALNGYTTGNFIAPEIVIELATRLEAAEKEIGRLEWIIGLHPAIGPSVIAMKETK